MAGIDALSSSFRPPLRIARAEKDTAPSAVPTEREEQLTQQLDAQLSSQLNRIRTRLAGDETGVPSAPNPPGAGFRLDILA